MRNALTLLSRIACGAMALVSLMGAGARARADEQNPLRVPDMTSPRTTLEGFIANTDEVYSRWARLLDTYLASGDLYLSANLQREMRSIIGSVPRAIRVLDMSNEPPILRDTLSAERTLQFREILDRIPLPDPADVPDGAAMAMRPSKRWRLPDTEIEFALVEQGPRTGEYLLTPETVERLPEFYRRVRGLPYHPGPAHDLWATYHRFAPDNTNTIYEIFVSSPVGLSVILPMRWMLAWPEWVRVQIGGAAVWQWIGIAISACGAALLLIACRRVARALSARNEDSRLRRWHTVPLPIGILFTSAFVSPMVCQLLHLGNTPRIVIAILETSAFYLSCAWLALSFASIVGEAIVGTEKLGIRSLDGQLVRLASRLVGALIALGCIIRGADELGLPAYSVLAGLGVGGLAVALAAKDSLANLLGSLLIMFEKPFRIGHYIRLSGTEGIVENVGFRSTRIRTLDNSLISIPNDSVINSTVENLTLRPKRRERLTIGVTYDTPRTTLTAFIDGIRQLIEAHELAAKDGIQVSLNDLADSSLNILVIFHLFAADHSAELRGRHEILLSIMELAETEGISFAFPTRTLVIEGTAVGAARDRRAEIIPLRS